MYSLFALLFKRAYWRTLLRGGSWVDAWGSLRRAHKDKRARKHLRGFAWLLIVPCICLAYVIWITRTGALIILPFLLPFIWWNNRRKKRDELPLHIAPQSSLSPRQLTQSELAEIRTYFAKLAVFYAVMTDRAGSEGFLKQKVLPEGFEVTSRRAHLDLLRSAGLWEHMTSRDREAMMMPDGHWDWPLINEVSEHLEKVRLLRWVLRIDHFLPVVGRQLKGDYKLAHEIVLSSQRVTTGGELATEDQLETAKGAAQEFMLRCLAESLARGYYTTQNHELQIWAQDLSASLNGKQQEDLLLADKLVSEADEPVVRWATKLSRTRFDFLKWSLELRRGSPLPDSAFTVFSEEEPGTA